MAYIILRDIPKYKVGLDVFSFPIHGGFRGFQNVFGGYHEIRVYEDDDNFSRYEIIIPLTQSFYVEVLIWDGDRLRVDRTENAKNFEQLAVGGAMNQVLINPALDSNYSKVIHWFLATSYIDRSLDDIALRVNSLETLSRFHTFWNDYQGNTHLALKELQSAFAKVVLRQDNSALERLKYLVQTHYHAGERGIEQNPDYFVQFARSLQAMFLLYPDLLANPNSGFRFGADYLVEDMLDYGEENRHDDLVKASYQFKVVLN